MTDDGTRISMTQGEFDDLQSKIGDLYKGERGLLQIMREDYGLNITGPREWFVVDSVIVQP